MAETVNTCETCRYWDKIEANHGECNHEKFIYDDWHMSKPEIYPSDSLIYCECEEECSSLARAYFQPGKDFGCIHHKAKGAEND